MDWTSGDATFLAQLLGQEGAQQLGWTGGDLFTRGDAGGAGGGGGEQTLNAGFSDWAQQQGLTGGYNITGDTETMQAFKGGQAQGGPQSFTGLDGGGLFGKLVELGIGGIAGMGALGALGVGGAATGAAASGAEAAAGLGYEAMGLPSVADFGGFANVGADAAGSITGGSGLSSAGLGSGLGAGGAGLSSGAGITAGGLGAGAAGAGEAAGLAGGTGLVGSLAAPATAGSGGLAATLQSFLTGGASLGTYAQTAAGLYGLYQGSQMKSAGQAADPFAQYRSGFAQQLQQLMANPGSVTSLPGYQFGMDQAQGALTKNLASQGLTGSGTAAQAIANQGQTYASQMYQQQLQNLSGLSGATMNNAGLSLSAQASGSSLQNQSLNNLVKAFPSLGGG